MAGPASKNIAADGRTRLIDVKRAGDGRRRLGRGRRRAQENRGHDDFCPAPDNVGVHLCRIPEIEN
jgi:hypothetical protein